MKYMLFVLLLIPSFVLSITHTVKLDGTGNFTNIQAAINVANPADTVLVYPGRYYENINFNGKHGINLFSLEAVTNDSTYINSTIIDGNQNGTCVEIFAEEQNLKIQGFSITNGSGYENSEGNTFGGGIMMSGNTSIEVKNCNIFNNKAFYGGGTMFAADDCSVMLSGVKIYNNYASLVGGGVNLNCAPSVTFSSTNLCSIYGNYAAYGCDVFIDDYSSQSIVELNLDMFTVMQPTGYFAYYQDRYSCFGYTSPNMRFNIRRSYLTEIDADIYVSPNGSDANNGLTPQTPFKTIKKALYMVKPNSLAPNTVHLAEGVYTNNDEQMFPLAVKSYTKVIGAGKGQTKILNNSGTIVTLCITRNAYNILLEGFSVSNQVGSNLGMAYTSHIYIKNVAFTGATSESNSGFSCSYSGKLTLDGVDVTNNIAETHSAGAYIVCDTLIIKNSKFMNNTSNGPPEIGLHNNFETDVTDSLYIGNSIFMNALNHSGSGTNALLVRSREHSVNPTFVIENCLIAANVSTCSNAVCSIFTNGKTAISNCTFANNSTNSNNDYTLGIKGHPVTISNSIFYSNDTPCQIKCYGLGATTLNLHNNIIQGGQRQINPGGNIVNYNDSNLNINPDFLGGDQSLPEYYYLSYQSPAINAGTSNLPFSLSEFDLANEPRVYQGIVDIGCYEWQGTTNITDINKLPNTQLTAFNTPNPFNPSTKICFNSPYNGKVKVDIYNVKGQKVKTLANKHFDAGVHKLYWNGKNANNQATVSGVYFYKIKTQNKTIVNKMLMLK